MTDVEPFDALLARARKGDEAAIVALVQYYEHDVRIVARARLSALMRPYVDSVDLVQSVHRSLLIGLRNDKFDISHPNNLVALAVTIVQRKVARHWRRARRQQRLDASTSDSQDLAGLLTSSTDGQSDPASIAMVRDQIERVLSQLDENDRQLIELRIDGHSTASAARELGLDPDVCRVRLSRLRRRLQDSGMSKEVL